MELTLSMFLIVCPLSFLGGIVGAIGGGGGLVSLTAYLLAGLPANTAVFTNKLSTVCGMVVSGARYYKNNCVDFKLAAIGVVAAAIGGFTGAHFALMVDEVIFKILLLILLPLVSMYVLLKKDLEPKNVGSISRRRQCVIVAISTLLLGIYAGFYGPGSGTFLILVYSALAKMNLLKAAGNAKVTDTTAEFCSLLVFLSNGVVLIPLGFAGAIFSIMGNYIGTGMAIKNGNKVIRIVILSVLALLLLKIIFDAGSRFLSLI